MIENNDEKRLTTLEPVEEVVEMNTDFSKQMDIVKSHVLDEAQKTDAQFVKTVKENLKDAAVKHTQVEQKKAEFQKQQVDYESDKLHVKQVKTEHEAKVDIWENRKKRRDYHYDGVKPILQFVGIEDSLNLIVLYFLTIVLVPFFLISKFARGTIGIIIAGASDQDRPRAVKAFLWTLIGTVAVMLVLVGVYLFLKSQGIDILHK